jgi:RIO kinase 1
MDDNIVARGEALQYGLEATAYNSAGLGLTRDTRATVDAVLDPQTIAIVQKLIKQGFFDELAGCISTGKEANVYFGLKNDGSEVAVKIYKTSILGFRDRDEYVDGEFRFRHGYCKSNPRKMVSLWAEKEQRNLNRLRRAGIVCPPVLACKRNVVIMSLAGKAGKAAPRLKDAPEDSDWSDIYRQAIFATRKMFQACKLVHGDLSEYNLLLEEGVVVMIDVSQSVGVDHPRSMEFLKRDCFNLNQFFSRKLDGAVIPLQELFQFVIQRTCPDEELAWEALLQKFENVDADSTLITDNEFMQTWIPASLSEIGDMKEVERLMRERCLGLNTAFDEFLAIDTEEVSEVESEYEESDLDNEDEESWESESSEGSLNSDSERAPKIAGFDGHRPVDMSKQEWKKLVKEERRELRANKVPKHLKQKRNLKKYGKK